MSEGILHAGARQSLPDVNVSGTVIIPSVWPSTPTPPRQPVVLTMGTFDLFHDGHVFLLSQCRKLAGAGQVVVALNTDEFVARFKSEPTHSLLARAVIIGACRYVDQVITNTGDENAKVVLEKVAPTWLVIGQDWACRDYYGQLGITQDWLNAAGISLVYVPRPDGTMSSTEVRERIRGK